MCRGQEALLENRREDERASAGDLVGQASAQRRDRSHLRTVNLPGDAIRIVMISVSAISRSTGSIASAMVPLISMESLILAQDERWRRA
jgi:hypothetical protein